MTMQIVVWLEPLLPCMGPDLTLERAQRGAVRWVTDNDAFHTCASTACSVYCCMSCISGHDTGAPGCASAQLGLNPCLPSSRAMLGGCFACWAQILMTVYVPVAVWHRVKIGVASRFVSVQAPSTLSPHPAFLCGHDIAVPSCNMDVLLTAVCHFPCPLPDATGTRAMCVLACSSCKGGWSNLNGCEGRGLKAVDMHISRAKMQSLASAIESTESSIRVLTLIETY